MAPLPDLRGYIFKSAIEVLHSAYASAARALVSNIEAIEERKAAYLASDVVEEERDEEDNLLWDREKLLDIDLEMTGEALSDLRKAFALAAYHLWERSARQWAQDQKSPHDDLAAKVARRGIAVHPRLAAIRDLANTLKHNSRSYGPDLVVSWPAVFPPGFAAPRFGDWYAAIRLDDGQVREVFDIVLGSGPTVSVGAPRASGESVLAGR